MPVPKTLTNKRCKICRKHNDLTKYYFDAFLDPDIELNIDFYLCTACFEARRDQLIVSEWNFGEYN
jgi:hypothetical protein